MRRVLVTGASGFLGHHLVSSLQLRGLSVTTAGRASLPDVADLKCWKGLLEPAQPEVIFHLLGPTAAAEPSEFDAAHVRPTTALLAAARELGFDRTPIIVLGSAAEYGDVPESHQPIVEEEPAQPASAYGRSKLRATEAALAFAEKGMHVAVVRLFNVFGLGMSSHMMPGVVLAQLQKNPARLEVGPLDRVRDFLRADIAMGALAQLALAEVPRGSILNLCSGQGLDLRDIVRVIISAAGFAGELHESREDSAISKGVRRCIGSPSRLENILGFRPQAPTLEDFAELVK